MSTRGLAALGAFSGLLSLGVASSGLMLSAQAAQWATVVFPPVRLPEFIIGVVLSTLVSRGWRPRLSLWWTGPLAVIAVVVDAFVPEALVRYAVTLVPFVLLVLSLAVADLRSATGLFRFPVLVTLGVWSYCFYLLHGLALWISDAVAARLGLSSVVSVAMALFLTLVAAWALHTCVEKPCERQLRPARPRVQAGVLRSRPGQR